MHDQTLIELRVETLEKAVSEINNAVKSIDQSMQAIVRLEVHHADTRDNVARAFTEIEDHEKRLRELEKDAPTMRLVRGWIVTWVVGIVGLVGVALVGLVVAGTGVPVGLL